MKQKIVASTLGFALIASSASIPLQKANAVMFSAPPDSSIPSQASGGEFRGSLFTRNSGESAPSRATGGASRRGLFTRKSGESAPSQATGGASRDGLFTRNSGESAPSRATGGASRDGLFSRNSGESAPQSSAGGASREGRRYLNFPHTDIDQPAAILALLPQTYFGTTVSQRAEIMVYLPQSQAREGVFSLKDSEGNTLHEMNVPVSGQTEVITIKIPTDLQLEKNYQWFLALKIDGQLTTRTPYVDGWIKRIRPNPEIAASMQQKDLLKQATAFGKHGVWYDCVATLAKLRATQPNNANLDKEWSELLESVGLKQIEKAPVVASNLRI
jgi:hypothetical protein